MTLLFYIDPLIYSNIPGNSYVIGLSIVFAAYTFGAAGVLLGPLLAGMSFTFLSIYRDYISLPLYAAPLPVPTSTLGGVPASEFGLAGLDATGLPTGTGSMEGALAFGFPSHHQHHTNASMAATTASRVNGMGREIGSMSTSHSSNTLAQLANGLQQLADRPPTSGASSMESTPLSRAHSLETSPAAPTTTATTTGTSNLALSTPSLTQRQLRFAHTPMSNTKNGSINNNNMNLDAINDSPPLNSATVPSSSSIVEGNEDMDHDASDEHIVMDEIESDADIEVNGGVSDRAGVGGDGVGDTDGDVSDPLTYVVDDSDSLSSLRPVPSPVTRELQATADELLHHYQQLEFEESQLNAPPEESQTQFDDNGAILQQEDEESNELVEDEQLEQDQANLRHRNSYRTPTH